MSDERVWRLLDANANRAREGLRVVEDTARFILDHAAAAKALRGLRHRLDQAVRSHYGQLLRARHVESDSGRTNKAETSRRGVADLLAANFKRVEEALRALEEYGGVMNNDSNARFQKIRFETYAWERKLLKNGIHEE